MGLILRLLACLVLVASIGHAQMQSFPPTGGSPIGTQSPCTAGDVLTTSGGAWICAAPPGAGTGAPATASYWVRVQEAPLTAESIMANLATGLILNTNATGVPTIYPGGSCTNQFLRALNPSGTFTCAAVALADLGFDPATQAELDASAAAVTAAAVADLDAHQAAAVAAHAASAVSFLPTGGIAATNAQSAIAEAATDAAAALTTHEADTTNVHGIANTAVLLKSGDAAGGDLAGTYPNPTIAANAVALTADTTGDYVSGVTANQGLLKTGTEGATLGLIDCAAGEILKRDVGDTSWGCATDASGGAGGNPGGADTQVQYNAAGVFAGDAGLTYNAATDTLTAGAFVGPLTGNLTCTGCVSIAELGFDPATQAEFDAYTGRNLTVALASTALEGNLTLAGEQTRDGVLTSSTRFLVKNQTLGQENGCYVTAASAWSRCTDFNTTASYLINRQTHFRVTGGNTQAGTIWELTNTSAILLGTTPLGFAQIGGPGNPAPTVMGSRSLGTGATQAAAGDDNRLASVQTPSPLSASSQINADKPTQIITGSGAAVILTNPKWLTDGDFPGQTVELFNPSATNTVTGPTTATIINCGGTGSVVIGLNHATPRYTWTGAMWQLGGCLGLQQAANVGKLIDITGTQQQWREGNSGWDMKVVAGQPVLEGIESGGPTHIRNNIPAGKDFIVSNATGSATYLSIDGDTGQMTGLAIGPSVLGANNNSAFSCSSGGDFTYNYPFGRTNGAETDVRMRVPRTGNAAKLRVRLGSPIAAGQTALFTLRKNGGATALACSIIGGLGVGTGEVGTNSDVECNDITDAIPLIAGTDDLNIEIVCSGGATAMPPWTTAFVIE